MHTRIILAAAAALCTITLTAPADARPRNAKAPQVIDVAAIPAYPFVEATRERRRASRAPSRKRGTASMALHTPATDLSVPGPSQAALMGTSEPPKAAPATRTQDASAACPRIGGSTSLARIVEPLKAKAEEIIAVCGSRVLSSDCRGGVTPNHRNHRAVDLKGNPRCMYALLKDWPGGVSTDYGSAPGTAHVHVSYCPPGSCKGAYEWGLRFAHRHPLLGARHAAAAPPWANRGGI